MPRPENILTIGLQKYLNDTAELHYGHGYDDFIKLIDVPIWPSIPKMARYLGVSIPTMNKYLTIYEIEKVREEEL